MAVYFFYGEEDYNIDSEINKLRSELNPDFISMSYQVLNNPVYQELITVLRTPPMMFGKMLVIINTEKYFSGNKNWFEDDELNDIEDALKNNPETLDIAFVLKIERDSGKKPDSRRKLFKILSKFNSREFPAIPAYKTDIITGWIKNKAKEKNLTIIDKAAELLAEQIGNNLRQFDIELDKLKLIAYPEKKITEDMVKNICTSNQDLFNITNCIMKNEKDRALLEFKKLTDKKHPVEILSGMQTILRQWIIIKAKSDAPIQEVMNMSGVRNEYRIEHLRKDLKNVHLKDLVAIKNNLYNVEFRIKKGEVLDIESEVECAIIR